MRPSPPEQNLPRCSLPRRLSAMFYDALVVIALLMTAAFVVLPVTGPDVRAGSDPAFTAYLVMVAFAYFGGCWRAAGATLGMRAWRVRLESGTDGPPGWGQCAVRFMTAIASGLVAGLGFAWALFDSRRRCWHDLASGTWLVTLPRASNRAP